MYFKSLIVYACIMVTTSWTEHGASCLLSVTCDGKRDGEVLHKLYTKRQLVLRGEPNTQTILRWVWLTNPIAVCSITDSIQWTLEREGVDQKDNQCGFHSICSPQHHNPYKFRIWRDSLHSFVTKVVIIPWYWMKSQISVSTVLT